MKGRRGMSEEGMNTSIWFKADITLKIIIIIKKSENSPETSNRLLSTLLVYRFVLIVPIIVIESWISMIHQMHKKEFVMS